MIGNLLLALLFILAGLFTVAGGLLNWNSFMLNRRARLIVRILGRGGARVFYVIFGVAMVGLGLFALVAAFVMG